MDEVIFVTLSGRKLRYVKMYSPTIIMGWEILRPDCFGANRERLIGINVNSVSVEVLKSTNIWNDISEEIRNKLVNKDVSEVVSEVVSQTNKTKEEGMGRISKHVGVPNSVKCSKCGNEKKIAPCLLVAKIEKSGKSQQEYLSSYECSICSPPKKGRKPNQFATLYPKNLTCYCGNTATLNLSYLKIKAAKTGKTIQELIDGFKCQVCQPTKGRPKKITEIVEPEVTPVQEEIEVV